MELLKRKEQTKSSMSGIYYSTEELAKLEYIKVIYKDSEGTLHEIKTDVKFIGDVLISVYFKYNQKFDIKCPQEVTLKFVTSDAMYLAMAGLQEVKESEGSIYLSIKPPEKMIRQQNRKYCRVALDRACVLVVTDENDKSTTYLSRSVNLSAGGVLINDLETMLSDEFVDVDMPQYGTYHVIIFLEPEITLKLFARYVRHSVVNGSHQYAFKFMNVDAKYTDLICKYVTNEQIKQLKQMQQYK